VRDYRLGQLNKMPNVEIYRESELSLQDALDVGAGHIVVATGARWRRDGYGTSRELPMDPLPPADKTFTPDDIMADNLPVGSVLVYDDDGFYMANLIAEKLRKNGNQVYYVTPHSMVARWSGYTDDQVRVHQRVAEVGAKIILNQELASFDGSKAMLNCAYTGVEQVLEVENLVLVTCRTPQDSLYHELQEAIDNGVEGAPKSVKRIGDAEAPAIIAAAVFAGHRYARDLDAEPDPDMPLKIDRVMVE
jgi:dimethylamine/trimethylamine dehydrogenase